MKQIFMLGLVVGMVLCGIIIISFFVLGNPHLGLDKLWSKNDYAPYFKNKIKGLFLDDTHQPPYRIKKIERDGNDYIYILKGVTEKPFEKPEIHPNRKPVKVSPM